MCSLDSTIAATVDYPTNYSVIIAQSRLAGISNLISSELFSPRSQTSFDLGRSRSIEHRLKAWKLSLPVYFSTQTVPDWFHGPRAVVIWKELNLRMMLWWGSHRLCTSPREQTEARNMCQYTAIETIQEIATFCQKRTDYLHPSLTWYATYFLFQAVLVLNIYSLQPDTSGLTDMGPATADQELSLLAVSRTQECLVTLSKTSKPATRCLEVLERIKRTSQQEPSREPTGPTSALDRLPDFNTATIDPDAQPAATSAADPALQIFFQNTSLETDPFEGIGGFPSTQELEIFDYFPLNGDSRGD